MKMTGFTYTSQLILELLKKMEHGKMVD